MTLLAALLALILAQIPPPADPPADLAVQAAQGASGVVLVQWAPVPGAGVACIIRRGPDRDQLIGCTRDPAATRYAAGPPWDQDLTLGPGDVVEVQVWSVAGDLLARGRAAVRGRAYLPVIQRPAGPPPRARVYLPAIQTPPGVAPGGGQGRGGA